MQSLVLKVRDSGGFRIRVVSPSLWLGLLVPGLMQRLLAPPAYLYPEHLLGWWFLAKSAPEYGRGGLSSGASHKKPIPCKEPENE